MATRGNSGLAYPYLRQSECALRKRYVQLLSGFVGTAGGVAGLVLPLSELSWRTEIPSLIGTSWEEVYSFVDRESL